MGCFALRTLDSGGGGFIFYYRMGNLYDLTSCFSFFADVCVLLITEGLANLALVGGSMTVFKAKVEKAMPRKSGAAALTF